jgi:Xaa-Pro dipeptidase
VSKGFLDRGRAEKLMRAQGLDALVFAQPETIRYATGAFPGVATFWRRAGAAFVVVPQAPGEPLAAIVGDLQAAEFAAQSGIADVRAHALWVETGDARGFDRNAGAIAAALVARDAAGSAGPGNSRPATFSAIASLALLRDVLAERGLLNARIGLEMGFVPAADFPMFGAALPRIVFIDCSPLVARLRALKQAREIALLRTAAELSMLAIQALLPAIRPGLDSAGMTAIWRQASRDEAARRAIAPPGSDWAYIAVGGDGFAPGGAALKGDIVKIDTGCVVEGYSSDGARTAVLGKPDRAQRAVYDALRGGFDVGMAMLAPGVRLSQIHAAVLRAIQDRGFLAYRRGHFGHGVGASLWSEEWPFISADSDAVAEPNMALAFETPYYISGLGGFIIEDQVLITERGAEIMGPAPHGLFEAAVA